MGFQSGYKSTLTQQLTPTGTLKVATAPTVTAGRMYLNNRSQQEWIDYTGVSGTELTGLTRGLSQTADPATAGTGLTRPAGTKIVLVAMHDQLFDRQSPEATVFATTAARDTALGADGAATKAYVDIYVTATGLFYNYNLSSNQWEDIDTGTTTPNANTLVAGKVEMSTIDEFKAGASIGTTGAYLASTPTVIGMSTQAGAFLYGEDAGSTDSYVISLIPTLLTYTEGQKIRFKANTINTGVATLNINGLGAKQILTTNGNNLSDGDIQAGDIVEVIYNSPYFVMQKQTKGGKDRVGGYEMLTDAEAATGTDETRVPNIKQIADNYTYTMVTDVITISRDLSAVSGSVAYNHGLGIVPSLITFNGSVGSSSANNMSGAYDGTDNKGTWTVDGTAGEETARSINLKKDTSNYQFGSVSAATTSNFTVDWTKVSSPTGTGYITATLIGITS